MSSAIREVSSSTRSALIDLLYRLADDGLILGHRNSEWTGLGPILEEDIAFSSMAQDKIGHAVAYYNLLNELGEPKPDDLAFKRTAEQFRCCELVTLESLESALPRAGQPASLSNNPDRDRLMQRGDWSLSLVRQFFFSEADALRLAALSESSFTPLAHLARKLRGEVKYHTLHGRMWIEKIGDSTPESHARLQHSVTALWPHALGMFEPTPHDDTLAQHGIAPTEAALCERWRDQVEPLLEKGGLMWPDDARAIYGGRTGRHGPALSALLDSMHKVHRLDPDAQW